MSRFLVSERFLRTVVVAPFGVRSPVRRPGDTYSEGLSDPVERVTCRGTSTGVPQPSRDLVPNNPFCRRHPALSRLEQGGRKDWRGPRPIVIGLFSSHTFLETFDIHLRVYVPRQRKTPCVSYLVPEPVVSLHPNFGSRR